MFAESRGYAGPLLASAALKAARERGLEVAAVYDAANRRARSEAWRRMLSALARSAFDAGRPLVLHLPMLVTLPRACRRFGAPLVLPPGRDVNDPGFVETLSSRLRPALALSLLCPQVFRPALLAVFERAVNYHTGLLPAYRGVRATSWSLYRGEQVTGFSYHLMTEGIDAGPVLLSDTLPIRPDATLAALEWEKTRLAAAKLGLALDSLARGDPGTPQEGPGGYFGRRDTQAITEIADPASLTWEELTRRLRAFDSLVLRLDGTAHRVTRLRRVARRRRPALAFVTADGILVEPDRFDGLPLLLHRLRAKRPG